MTNSEYEEKRLREACERKRDYVNPEHAEIVVQRLRKKGRNLTIYRCPNCGGVHLGNRQSGDHNVIRVNPRVLNVTLRSRKVRNSVKKRRRELRESDYQEENES